MSTRIDGYTRPFDVEHAGIRLPVFTSLRGEVPLIVVHEMPGMSVEFLRACERLVNEGFKVYAPLLYGEPGKKLGLRLAWFCLTAEFRALFGKQSAERGRPFAAWLAHLAEVVVSRHPERPVGVVGMCLTGSFALVGLAQPGVGCAVCCQPAFPFFFDIQSAGLTVEQRHRIAERAEDLARPCAKGYRYTNDRIGRRSHMNAVAGVFDGVEGAFAAMEQPGRGHSTVTDTPPNEPIFRDLIAFLHERLDPGPE